MHAMCMDVMLVGHIGIVLRYMGMMACAFVRATEAAGMRRYLSSVLRMVRAFGGHSDLGKWRVVMVIVGDSRLIFIDFWMTSRFLLDTQRLF